MKYILSLIIPLLILSSCNNSPKESKVGKSNYPFFVGTYTDSTSEGIYKYMLNKKGILTKVSLAAKVENPTFLTLAHDKKFVVAVGETGRNRKHGTVHSYMIIGDSLSLISSSTSGGAGPCYINSDNNSHLLTANYGGGNIGLLAINQVGKLSSIQDIQQHIGRGTTARQTRPHAHSAMFDPKSDMVVSADLGTDEISFSRIDMSRNKLVPIFPHRIKMEPGAGPRHMAFHPNGYLLYVINELNNTVTLLKKNNEEIYTLGSSVSTLPSDFSGESYCADMHISSDGNFLYASNRGHNSIAIFDIDPESGKLTPIGHQDIHGDWPRNFALSPDEKHLVVANKKSGNIVSFKRDELYPEIFRFVQSVDRRICRLYFLLW